MMKIDGLELRQEYITVNDVCLYVLSAGNPEDKMVLCLHGFPDTPDTFKYQFKVLVEQGYHVVAPFLRGYPPSQSGPNTDYFLQSVSEDALALIEHFTHQPAIIIGHDWGALAAYGAAYLQPQLIEKMITAAVPPMKVFEQSGGDLQQAWRSRYAMLFQCGPLANWYMRRNQLSGLDWLWSYWSPTWSYSAEDIAPLKQCLAQHNGMESATGYYRALVRGALTNKVFMQGLMEPISVPTMVCRGLDDGCIAPAFLDDLSACFSGEWELLSIEQAGHFLHREQAEQFNRAMLEFLG